MRRILIAAWVVSLLFLSSLQAAEKTAAIIQDQVVAGSPKDFMEVRHLVLRGSNEAIGEAIGRLSQERYGISLATGSDRLRTRVARRYIEKNYPILFERMRGVASAYGKDLEDDRYDFSGLGYARLRAGCSLVYYPPSVTTLGKGIFSRNYDFSTGTLSGLPAGMGQLASTARPYIMELHPDKGYASMAIYSYDLLCGVLDGINSEGLTVALLADDELASKFAMEPTRDSAVGLGVQQVLRFLLDTCANVDEAKEALLAVKQYYEYIPCHYLIADRHGKSFVWEYSQAHNREYIVDCGDKPLVTTNFSLHKHLKNGGPPTADDARKVCPRYCILCDQIAKQTGKFSIDFIKENQHKVDATRPPRLPILPPGRTLWHALYVPEDRTVSVSFYLGDKDNGGAKKIERTQYLSFHLAGEVVPASAPGR
jgi:hypothetical protein